MMVRPLARVTIYASAARCSGERKLVRRTRSLLRHSFNVSSGDAEGGSELTGGVEVLELALEAVPEGGVGHRSQVAGPGAGDGALIEAVRADGRG